MLKFFKESIKEFDHVVWPTNKETKKYFTIVSGLITALTIFLFIVGTIFSNSLFWLGKLIRTPKAVEQTNTSNSDVKFASWADLKLTPSTTTPAPAAK
jgi:preprotein translocase SecE subunit